MATSSASAPCPMALNDDDYQNLLATVVLWLQAITVQKGDNNKELWHRLPLAGSLIEQIGVLRKKEDFDSISEEDAADILGKLSKLIELQTLEPQVVATLGKLSEKIAACAGM